MPGVILALMNPEDNTFELELTGMAHGGSAIGRHEGRTIFVPYVIPGERIRARVVEDKGRYARAEVVEMLTPSPDRVTPRCPHFGPGLCGGCQWQHIDYAAQLRLKHEVVIDQLERVGKIKAPRVLETLPAPDPWAYRVHVTFHMDDAGAPGFWADDNRRIVPIEECHIIRPELMDLLDELAFEETTVNHVRLYVGSDGALMLALSAADDEPPELETDLPVSVNFLLSDNEPLNLIGSTHARYAIRGRWFRVTAGGFFQVNPPVAGLLVDEVMRRLNLTGVENVLDLYSGVGLFSAFIAERAALVTAVESYPPAVTDAEANLAEFDNVDLIEGAVEDALPDLEGPYAAAVIDPPRTGMTPAALDALVAHAPRTLVYVSCDPATLARDAARLLKHGYTLVETQPVDMFPQTFHIESVSGFMRAKV